MLALQALLRYQPVPGNLLEPVDTIMRRRFFCVVIMLAMTTGALFAAQENEDTPHRNIVILLDNHIFTDQIFHYDEDVLRANIRGMLEFVRPKRAVAFAVGHDGHAQYPSSYFPPLAPSEKYPLLSGPPQDLLKIWKEETSRSGTELFIYVSTLRNDALTNLRPDYLRVFINGANATVIDHNSEFAEKILLPGLQELIDRYDPDGFFLDADFWTIHESWNPSSIEAFRKETGLEPPNDYADETYSKFIDFTYRSYRESYVEKLVSFFNAQKKTIDWSLNSAFTFRDPAKAPDNYGTISIDLPFFALGEAYIESLFGQRQKKPSEIVYALFAQAEGANAIQYKSEAQLKQELAVAVANRSLISFYLPIGRDGTIPLDKIKPAIDVYDQLSREIRSDMDSNDGEVLAANVALVNVNEDAIKTRDFSRHRSISLGLFENGLLHAIITGDQAHDSKFTHLIFPSLTASKDTEFLTSLVRQGKHLLFAGSGATTDTKSIVAALSSTEGMARIEAEGCADCILFRSTSGGEVWIAMTDDLGGAIKDFIATADQPVTFIDKPAHVYATVFTSNATTTIYLSSVAWGGPAFGRHTTFQTVDVTTPIELSFTSPKTCVEHSSSGTIDHEKSLKITTRTFDTIVKISCQN